MTTMELDLDGTLDGVVAEGHQVLTFRLAGEEYGIDILRVQEIKGYTNVTPIPNAPPHVLGVINLRGAVIPVLDLRTRFGITPAAFDRKTVIIVVAVRERTVGLVACAVSDVLQLTEADVVPPPALGSRVDTSFLTGMARHGETLVLLLDIERLIAADDLP